MKITKKEDLIIVSLESSSFDYLVIGTSEFAPFYKIREQADLLFSKSNAKILIDSLTSVGNTTNRFTELSIENGVIKTGSRKRISLDRTDSLRVKVSNILRAEKEVIENTPLNSVEKDIIFSGIAI